MFEAKLKIKELKDKLFILEHPNGKTVNEIIIQKLKEESETQIPPEIQGAEIDGQFSYDRAHTASLIVGQPSLAQEVTVLFADSPCNIYVCPNDQIGLADKIMTQIANYIQVNEESVGFTPQVGKLCLAKSNDDGEWYRAACVKYEVRMEKITFLVYAKSRNSYRLFEREASLTRS